MANDVIVTKYLAKLDTLVHARVKNMSKRAGTRSCSTLQVHEVVKVKEKLH